MTYRETLKEIERIVNDTNWHVNAATPRKTEKIVEAKGDLIHALNNLKKAIGR